MYVETMKREWEDYRTMIEGEEINEEGGNDR